MKRLGVLVDGVPLGDAEAHAFWDRFSLYMDAHRGDLAGFAAQEGFASVHPGVDGDRPVLRASKTAPQKAYAAVKGERNDHNDLRTPGGSPKAQGGAPHPDRPNRKRRDSAKKSAG